MQINFQEEIAVFNLMKQIWFGFFSFKCNQIGSDNNLLTGRPKKGGNGFFPYLINASLFILYTCTQFVL